MGVGVADGHMEGLRPAFPDLGLLNTLNHISTGGSRKFYSHAQPNTSHIPAGPL
jgi:hypothetical protein